MVSAEPLREPPAVTVVSGGRLTGVRAEQIERAVQRLLSRREVTGGARVRVKTGRCGRGPMVVQVNFRVGEQPARVVAVTGGVDDLAPALARLDRQLARMCAPWRPRVSPDRTREPMTVPCDAVLTRRKSVVLQRLTPLQAAQVMDAMDYDAHVFADADTGEDALVYRAGPSRLRLTRQYHVCPPGWAPSSANSDSPVPLIMNPVVPPVLTEGEALRRVRDYGLQRLFFTDEITGRGNLLYPRHDGNLGLISPSPAGYSNSNG
ncbi:sigma 54 modulation/S30EA ribosomal C-terminal domain-containing protein [Mycobacterium sp.]|uniref:sigma 54 modulation/S30EA ribosomal C-terminal domain-containing protein n=1 Tax=Mycobacterium sp. TaxID=1785 RepID=UPI003A8359F2